MLNPSTPAIHCFNCHLCQFDNRETCRRCHKNLHPAAEPEIKAPEITCLPIQVIRSTLRGKTRFEITPPLTQTNDSILKLEESVCVLTYALRIKAGLSQKALANKMHTSRTYISKVEQGLVGPTIKSFLRLCNGLEIEPTKFIMMAESLCHGA